MEIKLPDINKVLKSMMAVKAEFDGETATIEDWLSGFRANIKKNKNLIGKKTEKAQITILIILLNDLLMRAMRGERGTLILTSLQKNIRSCDDLNKKVYAKLLKESKYRWGKDGMVTIDKVVKYFRDELEWNFKTYFDQAQKNYMQNFPEDELLKIKNIGNKVRDLALGNFNENYIAVDLHIARVSTRIGLLNFGYTLFPDSTIEMGNSPQNPKHYLFFHKLFLKLSEMTEHEYAPADFCRSIWHFGRAVCSDEAKCGSCPIKKMCLTGMFSGRTKN